MRLVFFGTSEFAVPSLEALSTSGQEIVLCVTQPDRPQGRGLKPQPSPIKTAAQRLGLLCEEPADLRAATTRLQRLAPEVGVVVAYGRLIPHELLTLPRHGMLGLHPSLLPTYRGAAPIAWAIVNGESVTGVTTFRLNAQLDAGEIVFQDTIPITPRETAVTLSEGLAARGGKLLVKTLEALGQGRAIFRPQDEQAASYARKLSKEDGRINWTTPAVAIDRLVRGMVPWPGASTTWQGQPLKLCAISSHDGDVASARPGEIMRIDPTGIVVATGTGQVIIHELQLAGGRRMSAQEFLAGHPMRIGDILGT